MKLDFLTQSQMEAIAADWENEAEQAEADGDKVWYNICIDEATKAAEALRR